MDERTYGVLRAFKRRGTFYILIPALVVSLTVALIISAVFVNVFGRSMRSGLNGLVAGSMVSSASLDDPAALGELQGDIEALRSLGQFAFLSVKAPDGRVLAATRESQVAQGLDPRETAALTEGKSFAYIGRCDCGDIELMVVGPLTRAEEEEPYGVVRGHRDIALVVPFVSVTVVVMVLVIMSGAFTAMIMLRRFVRRAERAFADDQKVIDALDRRLKHSLHELEEHSVGTLQALVAAVDARDTYTAHHSLNVSDYSCAIARQMGLRDELGALERAGLLHDIGKIGVSEYALLKPGRLTPEEYASIKEHSEIGARIIEMAPFLSTIVPVIRHHHERWDGEGYPAGLAGEDIPQLSRILGVADALDAMTSHRSYRNALSVTRARKELIEGRGSQFDPAVVDATVALLDSQAILPRRIAPATV